jgi:membrane protease YdiL (CAAX protease family)
MVTNTPRVTLQVLWRVALFMLVFALFGGLFLVPVGSVLSAWQEAFPRRTQLYFDTAGAVAILAATWSMTRFVDRRPFLTIGLSPGTAPRDLVAGVALGTGWLAMSVGVAWAAGWASYEAPVALSGPHLLLAATSVFLNVLTQQLLLCGYIFQTIRSRSGFLVSTLVSATLFSAYHVGAFEGAWVPAVNVFAAAVLFCLAYEITGTLWFPLGIHFAWNLLLGPVLGLTVSGTGQLGLGWKVFVIDGPAYLTGGAFGLEGGLVVTLTTTLLVVVLNRVRSRKRAR